MIIDNSRFFTATYLDAYAVIITLLDRVLVMVYILVNYNKIKKKKKNTKPYHKMDVNNSVHIPKPGST